MATVRWIGLCGALVASFSCGSDGGSVGDGGDRDAPRVLSENTAAICSDKLDNDGDGFVDCLDQDCWPLELCRSAEVSSTQCKDGEDNDRDGKIDCADPDCADFFFCRQTDGLTGPDGTADGGLPDGAPDAPLIFPDSSSDVIAPPDGDPPTSCSTHCDCQQGAFCYKGTCVKDPKLSVYCCAKAGCPPGRWCVDYSGIKGVCGEDPSFVCSTACDCGPAHCCVPDSKGVKRCVKDTTDPWMPGGVAIAGLSCDVGVDPTYCCADAECHAARQAYGAKDTFRCYSAAKARADTYCGGAPCFGSACACEGGELCLDTLTTPMPPAGTTCRLLSGGSCVGMAAAEAVFGVSAAEVLPCCEPGCTPGTPCDAGWKRQGGKYAYQRVVGTCGACANGTHFSCGKCGNKQCDEGESPEICPKDCSCGDGVCAPSEYTDYDNPESCPADCGECGDGTCDPDETPDASAPYFARCAADCSACGDGWCSGSEATVGSCPQDCLGICSDVGIYPSVYRVCGDGVCADAGCDEPENCRTCPVDCGACGPWTVMRRKAPSSTDVAPTLSDVWGSSSTDVLAVGAPSVLRFDGNEWKAAEALELTKIWGASATQIWGTTVAVSSGGSRCTDSIVRFDGTHWKEQIPFTCLTSSLTVIHALWGSAATDIWAVGEGADLGGKDSVYWGASYHFDGATWSPGGGAGTAVWGSSSTDVFAVAGSVIHFDGTSWSPLSSTWSVATAGYDQSYGRAGVWGSSPTDVFFVGNLSWNVSIAHYDGNQVTEVYTFDAGWGSSPDVWGTAATNVFVVGQEGLLLHYDGSDWRRIRLDLREYGAGWSCPDLTAIWGTTAGEIFVVGERETILHCSGSACGAAP